ncbi:DNA topoisomerase IB [Streptosporangiaceae bacterium NEAU-GS5]|nr:DNA topoisomerase IB [Streptosporangiaceae bacterium NEAU-GS5]
MRQSSQEEPGIGRRGRGKGFEYAWPSGRRVTEKATLSRIKALVIPPAWTDVWICTSPDGHLQAAGTDSAGRRQYRYHDDWRVQQDAAKFDRVLELAQHLPKFRDKVTGDLAGEGLNRERVLATAARMLDIGFFRVGGEEYTDSYGLATLRSKHVRCEDGRVVCHYPAKGGKDRVQVIADPAVCEVVTELSGRRGELLRYEAGAGWVDVRSGDINDYLREAFDGMDVTAKDFRTWHATVLAAVGLAVSPTPSKRAVARVIAEVADYLGDTPAVARASYVDPRIVDAYESGRTIPLTELGADADPGHLATWGPVEQAVIDLLRRERRRRP